jgi:N-methylhydantoinase A
VTAERRTDAAELERARIGVDVGGTFTDLVVVDRRSRLVRVEKRLTNRSRIEDGVLDLVRSAGRDSGPCPTTMFVHGTTVALNMLLERSGARVGLLATAGFRDVLELRRGERARMYDLRWVPDPPLVPRYLRIPIHERIRADGAVECPLEADDVSEAAAVLNAEAVDCVAICFLNAYRNPAHELEAAQLIRAAGFVGDISLSHETSGEHREYERTSTTVIDAYVRPRVATYLHNLELGLRREGFGDDLYVTSSGGGAMTFAEAQSRPFETIESGPAAGAVGAAEICRTMGLPFGVAADVGGTSFDTWHRRARRPGSVGRRSIDRSRRWLDRRRRRGWASRCRPAERGLRPRTRVLRNRWNKADGDRCGMCSRHARARSAVRRASRSGRGVAVARAAR